MGVVFFVIALLAMLVGGAGLLILGIVLRKALKKRARAGGRWARFIRGLAVPAIIFGLIGVILPLIYFGFILYESATPPDDFVETAIVIEEEGYQDERFTADGVTYLRLPFNDAVQHGEPVFAYKEKGWYTASQWGNYYRIENGVGCDLVSNRYSGLFCPEDQYDRVVEAYESAREADSIWFVQGEQVEVSDELRAAFRAVQALEGEGRQLLLGSESFQVLSVSERSFDGVVLHDSIPLLYTSEGVFLEQIVQSHGNERYSFRALPIPDQWQGILIKLRDSV